MASRRKPLEPRSIFVLDTNVLMHDPAAIFRFDEHDIYLPMVVLEELDATRRACRSRRATCARCRRFLDEIMSGADKAQIDARPAHSLGAVGMASGAQEARRRGRLFFQTRNLPSKIAGRHCPATAPTT